MQVVARVARVLWCVLVVVATAETEPILFGGRVRWVEEAGWKAWCSTRIRWEPARADSLGEYTRVGRPAHSGHSTRDLSGCGQGGASGGGSFPVVWGGRIRLGFAT